MTALCHQATEAIALAALWFVTHRHEVVGPVVPALRARFGLSAKEACEALVEAGRIIRGGAHDVR